MDRLFDSESRLRGHTTSRKFRREREADKPHRDVGPKLHGRLHVTVVSLPKYLSNTPD